MRNATIMVDIGKKRRVEGPKGASDGYGTDYISRQKANNKSMEEIPNYDEYNFGYGQDNVDASRDKPSCMPKLSKHGRSIGPMAL